jgi:ribosome maturation protein SDO1
VIERVMKEIHYAVIPNRSAKQQALEVIKKLEGHIPIARAKMKIQISAPAAGAKLIKAGVLKDGAEIVDESWGDSARMVVLINPGSFRVVDALVQEHAAGTLGSMGQSTWVISV